MLIMLFGIIIIFGFFAPGAALLRISKTNSVSAAFVSFVGFGVSARLAPPGVAAAGSPLFRPLRGRVPSCRAGRIEPAQKRCAGV